MKKPMNEIEIATIKKSLTTDEQLIVFKLLLDAEKREDTGMTLLYSLCLTSLIIPEIIPNIVVSLIPLRASLEALINSAMNNPNKSRRN